MAKCSELSITLLELTEAISELPEVNFLDDVVTVMQRTVPNINRTGLVDAITEATATEKQESNELAKKLTAIKGEARLDRSLNNKIKELEHFLETGTFPESAKKDKKEAPEPIRHLKDIVGGLRKELSQTEAARKKRKEKIEPKVIENIKSRIAELETHLKEGTLPAPVGKVKLDDSGIVMELRELRDQLRKELSRTEPARIFRLRESIKTLELRIESGDIMPKQKDVLPQTKDLQRLEFEKKRLQNEIRFRLHSLKPKSVFERFVAEPFNAVRAMITGGEFSLVLRQGGWTAMSRPGIVAKALPGMFKSFASEQTAYEVYESIMNRENAPLYAKGKLHLAPIDGSVTLSAMEEVYMSHLIGKIPLIKNFQRAGLTFLNTIRADTFDILAATLPVSSAGIQNQKELEAISNYVNIATGRGGSEAFNKSAVFLNTIFFAPKYVLSRFQLITGQPLWKGTATTRKLIAQEYARAMIGLAVVYALGALAGGEIEDDPRSADFGKIRFGKTRLDPLFGLAQTATFLGRITLGGTKRANGEIIPIRTFWAIGTNNKIPYKGDNAYDVIARFFRYKLSPLAGTTIDILTGEDAIGQPVEPSTYWTKLVTPLAYRDIYEAMVEQGIPKGTAFGILTFFGTGLQTYGKPSGTRKIRVHKPN